MDETARKALKLLREIKSVTCATLNNNEPAARIADVMLFEEEGLYFVTAKGKPFYKQLKNHPRLALCGINKDYVSVRLVGGILGSVMIALWWTGSLNSIRSWIFFTPAKNAISLRPFTCSAEKVKSSIFPWNHPGEGVLPLEEKRSILPDMRSRTNARPAGHVPPHALCR